MIKAIGRQPIKDEFMDVDLGDQRLTQRLIHLAELLDREIDANIPQACGEWKEIKAAYRFFSNRHVNPEKLQSTHISNTITRMRDYGKSPLILIQDSTSFNYQSHPATLNLGSVGNYKGSTSSRGIKCHSGLIYTVHGTPLGLLFQEFWLRKSRKKQASIKYKRKLYKVKIEKKESFHWLQVIKAAHAAQLQVGNSIITVQDREADINEVFEYALNFKVGFVTRVDNNRKCIESGKESIRKYLQSSRYLGKMEIDFIHRKKVGDHLFSKRNRPSEHRKILIQLWWKEVTIRIKARSTSSKSGRKITVILAEEKPQSSIERHNLLSWTLFTDQVVNNEKDAIKIINYYLCRWQIEEYHRIYKAGCRVEDCRLGESQRLIRFLKLMGIIAWRQHYFTEIGREFSQLPASTCLTPTELQALNTQAHREPNFDLKLGDAWRLIAKLGGFMNRKSDRNPGPTTLWRGFKKIIYISEGIEEYQRIAEQQSADKLSKAA